MLVPLGFDLNDVDRWLDRHESWFELLGTIVMKLFWGFILLVCVLMGGAAIYFRVDAVRGWARRRGASSVAAKRASARAQRTAKDDTIGLGWLVCAVVVGYFAWIGVWS